MKWPTREQIERAMKILDKAEGSRPLPKDATPTDKIKYELCSRFVVYRRQKEISQKELALKLGVDPAQMSKILHYHIDGFSVDYLIGLLFKIRPKTTIHIDEAS